MRRGTKKWLGRVVAAGLIAGALTYVPYHVYARSGLARTRQLRRELATLKARNEQLRDETLRLARQAEALRDDTDAIERVARAELGWVRPGEIIVDLSRPAAGAAGAAPTGAPAPSRPVRAGGGGPSSRRGTR
jgi:cell division protein FtsB